MNTALSLIDIGGSAGRLAGVTYGERAAGEVPLLLVHPVALRGRCRERARIGALETHLARAEVGR